MSTKLPVVDFAVLAIDRQDGEIEERDMCNIGDQLVDAFSSTGFVYLTNCGVDSKRGADVDIFDERTTYNCDIGLLERATKVTETFFKLPSDVKTKYIRKGNDNFGWVQMEMESLKPGSPGDLKEAFNVTPVNMKNWPDEVAVGFQEASMDIVHDCDRLADRILTALAVGLKLEDSTFFVKAHGTSSMTTLRYLRYPPVAEDTKPGQTRCGEHSDYGSITLLFQDNIGGLQLCNSEGEWVSATPVPEAVVVNIGDLMMRWTADRLKSTRHRVVIPEEELRRKQTRRSLVYFLHPRNDVMVTCIDGSNKYEPINSLEYINMKFAKTY